ncbi:putative glycosyl transferase family 2 [Moraxella osloensis]|nr:putative glycosyl transferase family 2 [Moraxella osloensis]
MKVCFLIVIYNKELLDSLSLKTLIKLIRQRNEKAICRIVNNGPLEVKKIDSDQYPKNLVIDFQQSISNRPLSKIYNEFLNDYVDNDRFVILDDDSELSENYLHRVFDIEEFDLELPKIYNEKFDLFYPLVDWKIIHKSLTLMPVNKSEIFSIGSGLIISQKLLKIFRDNSKMLFNENFSLYGVDFSLFWEIKSIKAYNDITITSKSYLIHNMSLHGKINYYKRRELLISFALLFRHYPAMVNFKNFAYRLRESLINREFELVFIMIKIYLSGTHPNCTLKV